MAELDVGQTAYDQHEKTMAVCNALALLTYKCESVLFTKRLMMLSHLKSCWTKGHQKVAVVCAENGCMVTDELNNLMPESHAEWSHVSQDSLNEADDCPPDILHSLTCENVECENDYSPVSCEVESFPSVKEEMDEGSRVLNLDDDVSDEVLVSSCVKLAVGQLSSAELIDDLEATSKRARAYKCRICADQFVEFKSYRDHMQGHAEGRAYVCRHEGCSQRFSRSTTRVNHERTHSEARDYVCMLCEKKFKVRYSLQRHLKSFHHVDAASAKSLNCENSENLDSDLCDENLKTDSGDASSGDAQEPLHCEVSSEYKVEPSEEKWTYKCSICGKKFGDLTNFQRHSSTHNGERPRPYVCRQPGCSQRFARKSTRVDHELTHSDDRSKICPICGSGFKVRSTLWRHILTVHRGGSEKAAGGVKSKDAAASSSSPDVAGADELSNSDDAPSSVTSSADKQDKWPFKCSVCGKQFGRFSNFRQHSMIHAEERPFVCRQPGCSQRFARNTTRVDHERTHSKDRSQVCNICGTRFKVRSTLRRHLVRVHREKKTAKAAVAADAPLSPDAEADESTDSHHDWPYKCTFENCKKKFRFDVLRVIHERVHSAGNQRKNCPECSMVFKDMTALKRHALTHQRPYKCRVCGKGFGQSSTLNYHERTHNENTPYICSVCGRQFKQPVLLKMHMNSHSDVKPLGCSMCSARFKRRHQLSMHMRVHTGEKPYVCDVCSCRFSSSSILRRHQMVHTGVRPHSCDICSRKFTTRSNLRIHMRIHSGERPYKCRRCEQQFAYSGSLAQHVACAHPD